jgi:serine phosphatase RsbU (regulator of sigma subunit)
MERLGSAVGTSTPLVIAGQTIGYLTMSWSQDRDHLDPFMLDALDRFADQVALAKTVVRRRAAQDEAQQLARRFQAGMLPDLPEDGPVAVRALYRPGVSQMLLGGDFLDARVDPQGRLCFVLGDVAGHGPEQAALGATLRGAWRGLCSVPELDVADWARSLDTVVRESGDPHEALFATAVLGRLDPATRELTYVSAGHPPPLVLDGCTVVAGPLGDPPLGLLGGPRVTTRVVALHGARAVLLVTDGLFEGRRVPGETHRFDHDSFVELVMERGFDDLDGPGYLSTLADEMERCHGEPLPDDAAALLLRLGRQGR